MTDTKPRKTVDMLNGPLLKKIIFFALPLALSGILQLLFNSADQIVVGQFAGTESLAAVGSTASLINLITNLFIGLSVGANVLIAKSIGEGNEDRASKTVNTGLLVGLISGLFVAVLGLFCSRLFLELMKNDVDVIDKATLYLTIYFLGAPATLVYNFGAAALRAKGDTKRPLVYLIIAGVINVLFNLFFVIVCKLDVAGVALATIISQYVSATLIVISLFKESDFTKVTLKKLRIHKAELVGIIRIGVPAGIASSMFAISNVIMQSAINSFGKTVMAGHTAAIGLSGFVFTGMDAISQAAVTFVGQNYGAKKFDRIRRVTVICTIAAFVTGLAIGMSFVLLARPLASLYSTDEAVIESAITLMRLLMPFMCIGGLMNVFNSSLRGIGYSSVPTVISLVCVCAVRIAWVYTVFKAVSTLTVLYVVQPISWALAALVAFIVYFVLVRRVQKKEENTKTE